MMPRLPLLALTVALVASPATGVLRPRRVACRATNKSCVRAANGVFATARSSCVAEPVGPDRRTCLKTARAARATARQACRTALKGCLGGTGGGGGGGGSGGGGGGGSGSCNASSAADWLATVNLYRGLANLPAVTERTDLSAADLLHAQYMVANDEIGHSEDPANPGYSDTGNTAAQHSNVAGSSDATVGFGWAIDAWMSGPFHAVGIIDPLLQESGFGIAHDGGGTLKTTAALDVISSRSGTPGAYPVVFPADGKAVPLDRYGGHEGPDPLASCPGFTAPTGLPLIVQLAATPAVTAHTLTRDGTAVDHCEFDETSYANPDAAAQSTGRAVLGGRHAVVLIPKEPLQKGSTYQASITSAGQTTTWQFMLDCP
jgi:uncharacterized protein YkwD